MWFELFLRLGSVFGVNENVSNQCYDHEKSQEVGRFDDVNPLIDNGTRPILFGRFDSSILDFNI